MPSDCTVDALGTLCPEPMLRARQALNEMAPGQILALLADDPMAEVDLRVLCERLGHQFMGVEAWEPGHRFFIRKVE